MSGGRATPPRRSSRGACAIESRTRPSALLLSRQNLPYAPKSGFDASPPAALDAIAKGAYVLAEPSEVGLRRKAQVVIMATGSEVQLALHAQQRLAVDGIAVRVVSMPSTTVFDRQPTVYKQSVLPAGVPRVAVEMGVTDGWWKYGCSAVVGIDTYGESAPGGVALQALRLHARQCGRHGASGFVQSEVQGNVMTIKVAINGYGRIGRNILRAHYEGGKKHDIQIVAINDLGKPETNAHLTRYDTAHGPFPGSVSVDGDSMIVSADKGGKGGDRIKVLAVRNPAELPWKDLGVDVVLECTGLFTSKAKASAHLNGGAKKVIISAPGGNDMDATVVYGVNHGVLKASDTVISNASCTTNCLAPLVQPLHAKIGLVNGLMTTIHAYTNDQVLTDVYHEDLRRARSATHSMIPTKTGAASAVGLVLPELNGRLDGYAMRVPTINVSIVDLSFIAARDTTVDEIHAIMKEASSKGPLAGILAYSDGPLVSVDFNHNPASSTYDATLTKVSGRLVKVSSWYDNEWGFSNRMLDTTVALMAAK